MRRCGTVLALLALAITACSRSSPTVVENAPRADNVARNGLAAPGEPKPVSRAYNMSGPGVFVPSDVAVAGIGPGGPPPGGRSQPALLGQAEQRQKYDATLVQALDLQADKKWAEALAAFEAAEELASSQLTSSAIDRLRLRIDQEATAEQTTADIQAILDDGRSDDAAHLA